MNTHAAVMDAPETSLTLIETLKEYWGHLVFVGGVLMAIGACFKKVRAPVVYTVRWFRAAFRLPIVLEGLEADNVIEIDGAKIKVKDRVADLGLMFTSMVRWRRAMLNNLSSPTFEADKDGNFLWANDALLDLTDLEIPQIAGKNWWNFIVGSDRRRIVAGWEDAVRNCTDFRDKFTLITKDGERMAIFNATCNRDDLGNAIDFVGKIRLFDDPHTTLN